MIITPEQLAERKEVMIALGDSLWLASFERHAAKTIPCRVCFGKKAVTLILGNDDQVLLPCDYCGKGYNAPTGTEVVYEQVCCSVPFVVGRIEEIATFESTEHRYTSTDGRRAEEPRLFATKELADACARSLAEEYAIAEEARAEIIKHNVQKSFAWNAGYHMREAKDHERSAEYHRGRAVLCKVRSKEGMKP